jgi:hypothetical protein
MTELELKDPLEHVGPVEPPCIYSPEIESFPYELIMVICGHSEYNSDCIEIPTDETSIYTDPDLTQCTLSVADPGTCNFILDSELSNLIQVFTTSAFEFGQPPSRIMGLCKDFINQHVISEEAEVTQFVNCSGIITDPTNKYCNKLYDFFEEDRIRGGIYVLYKDPELIMYEPWKPHINNGNCSLTKSELLDGIHHSFPEYKNIIIIDFSCNKFNEQFPLPSSVIENIKEGKIAGTKRKTKKNKKKKKNKKSTYRIK